MAKKLVAVTNVKHDDEFFPAGTDVDLDKFTKPQLKALLDAGAVEIADVEDEPAEEPEVEAEASAEEDSTPEE